MKLQNSHSKKTVSMDKFLLSGAINLVATEEQLRWALSQPVPFVAVNPVLAGLL